MVQISAIPFLVLLTSDTLELITISSSDFTMLFGFGFLLLIPEWPQVNHLEKNFGNDDGAILNTKILLLSAFLIFTMHWPITSEIILLLASKLPSSIDLLGLLTMILLLDASTETIWSDLELGKLLAKRTLSNILERCGTLVRMISCFLLLMETNNHILHGPVRPVYRSCQTGLSRVAGNLLLLTCQCSLVASIAMFFDNSIFLTAQTFLSRNMLLSNMIITIKMQNTFGL